MLSSCLVLPNKTHKLSNAHKHMQYTYLENEVSSESLLRQLRHLLTLNYIVGFIGHRLGDVFEILLHLSYHVNSLNILLTCLH